MSSSKPNNKSTINLNVSVSSTPDLASIVLVPISESFDILTLGNTVRKIYHLSHFNLIDPPDEIDYSKPLESDRLKNLNIQGFTYSFHSLISRWILIFKSENNFLADSLAQLDSEIKPDLNLYYSISYSSDYFSQLENLVDNLIIVANKIGNVSLTISATSYQDRNKILNRLMSEYPERFELIDNIIDKINFLLDQPTNKDKLGRRPIARSLARLVNEDVFENEKKDSSFMIHLQGKWGEGKTSFMNFFEEELEKSENSRWIIVRYNAWKNQHINPPWWTFIDSLFKKGKETFKWFKKFKVIRSEFFRRLNHKSLITFIIIGLLFPPLVQLVTLLGLNIVSADSIKLLIAALTLGASLFALGKKGSEFFLVNSPKSVRLFISHVEDPTSHIKQHFKELVNLLTSVGKKKGQPNRIAFFIDDLDRCNAQFVVKLLEGIQTLFRDQKVLYLIAADRDWISNSFENVYSDYRSIASQNGASLGNFFVEKNFQLSLRLPNPSKVQLDSYWDSLLYNDTQLNDKPNSLGKNELKSEIKSKGKQELITGVKTVSELSKKYRLSIEETQNIVLDNLDETDQDIQHLLKDHGRLVGANPRTIKRIANQYTIFRNLILLEQNKVDQDKLFRWITLLNRFPLFVDILSQQGLDYIENFEQNPNALNGQRLTPYINTINKIVGKESERLTKEDVEMFLGIENING